MLVDFDGSSTDLHQLAQTFANAVKVSNPVPALPAPAVTPALPHQNGVAPPSDIVDAEVVPPPPSPPKPANGGKKTFKIPKVVEDLEFTSSKPLKEFVEEVGADSDADRYLAIAQWLKVHRKVEAVDADHIYSCFLHINKNLPDDVLSVFRALKQRGSVVGAGRGKYKITHIGEGQLNDMKAKKK